MSVRHILVSDGKSGREVHNDLLRHGFTSIEVHTRAAVDRRAEPQSAVTGDAPMAAKPRPGRVATGAAGASSSESLVRQHAEAIAAGQMLMVVDVPDGRAGEIDRLLAKHPGAMAHDPDA